jgi:glycosidase
MVNTWNAFATQDTRLLNIDNSKYHLPKNSCWMNYIRCHDDIGWGLNEDALRSLGIDPYLHKQYLIDFYSNNFKGSFSTGENYQYNDITKDARTNGTAASLLGLEKALNEQYVYDQEIALRRILLAHGMILSHRGIPLIYSGDELATLNDQSYKNDPTKMFESRWVHRPIFDWKRAKKRYKEHTFEYEIFNKLKHMIKIRKKHTVFNGNIDIHVILNSDISVYSFYKKNNKEQITFIFNFSEYKKTISTTPYHEQSINGVMKDLISGRIIDFNKEDFKIAPYEMIWMKKTE